MLRIFFLEQIHGWAQMAEIYNRGQRVDGVLDPSQPPPIPSMSASYVRNRLRKGFFGTNMTGLQHLITEGL